MTEREPMGLHIALSAAQLEHLRVPDWMTPDEVAECLDEALLYDDSVLAGQIEEFVYERETERILEEKRRRDHPDTESLEDTMYDHANPVNR